MQPVCRICGLCSYAASDASRRATEEEGHLQHASPCHDLPMALQRLAARDLAPGGRVTQDRCELEQQAYGNQAPGSAALQREVGWIIPAHSSLHAP